MVLSPYFRAGLIVLVVTLALDQASKAIILHVVDLPVRDRITITSFFDLTMAWNYGVSFGLFQQDSALGQWALVAFKVVAVVALAWWLTRAESRMTAWAIGLIAGGAIGNGIDRIVYGAVADFFAFHILTENFTFRWYIFNIADVGIVAGVALLLYESLFGGRSSATKSA